MQLAWPSTECSIVIIFQFLSTFFLKAIRKQTALYKRTAWHLCMSSVVIWAQVWMLELSVGFFNVNCKWQLAVGRLLPTLTVVNNLTFMENAFFDPDKNLIVRHIEASFHVKIHVVDFNVGIDDKYFIQKLTWNCQQMIPNILLQFMCLYHV